jgi:hypothetical protein
MADTPVRLDADNPDEVASGVLPSSSTFILADVGSPQSPQQLLIFTGTAIVEFEIPEEQKDNNITTGREQVEVILEVNLPKSAHFLGSTTYASLAAVNNDNDDNEAFGYRVTDASTIVRPDGALRVVTNIAVGFDAILLRMSYQATVLVDSFQ